MKVLTAAELAALPAGAIYSAWQPSCSSGLHRKGPTLGEGPLGWYESSLLPEPDIAKGDDEPALRGADEHLSRCLPEPGELFAVYEVADLEQLVRVLHAAPGMPAPGMARVKILGKVG